MTVLTIFYFTKFHIIFILISIIIKKLGKKDKKKKIPVRTLIDNITS